LKVRVQELEKLLEEERSKGAKERAEAEASLKASLERVRTEAAEELKRHDEAAARQQEQQNELILALQVSFCFTILWHWLCMTALYVF
jgi:F0F1-type ATP synthase membrane subunit b/b'